MSHPHTILTREWIRRRTTWVDAEGGGTRKAGREEEARPGVVLESSTADFMKLKVYASRRSRACWVTVDAVKTAAEPEEWTLSLRGCALLGKKRIEQLTRTCQEAVDGGNDDLPGYLRGVRVLCRTMWTDRFLPARSEIRAIRRRLRERTEDEGASAKITRANEREGQLTISTRCGRYKCRMDFHVPDGYPERRVVVHVSGPSFPQRMTATYENVANDVARKCAIGMNATIALAASVGQGDDDELRAKKKKTSSKDANDGTVRSADLTKIKNDLRFLKKASDLRQVNGTKAWSSKAHVVKRNNATRRRARRELKQMTRREVEAEESAEKERVDRDAEIARARCRGLDLHDQPTPHLAVIAEYLLDHFALHLPVAPCGLCDEPLLPSDPRTLVLKDNRTSEASTSNTTKRPTAARRRKERKASRRRRPIRLYCGHWFHHQCLDRSFTRPPFKPKPCPSCGKHMYHKAWPSDFKKLEKRWANEQATKREREEIAHLLGFGVGDEFERTNKDTDPVREKSSGYDHMF